MSGRHGSLASVENVVYTSADNITYGSPATPFRSKNAAKDGTEYSKHPPSDSLVGAPAKTGVRTLIEPCNSVSLHHVFQFATNISTLLKTVVSSYQLRISVSRTQYSNYRDPSARHEYLSHTENSSQLCVTSDRLYISTIVPFELTTNISTMLKTVAHLSILSRLYCRLREKENVDNVVVYFLMPFQDACGLPFLSDHKGATCHKNLKRTFQTSRRFKPN
ncbi:hypothetical protein QR685DRAFT_208007 [Neurospora intermedia]|uniref:Uncharacterized protein n=1 Tax=Neurospora intermedia TaxID=5142 RepID=A0ABR3DI72_NEUIN